MKVCIKNSLICASLISVLPMQATFLQKALRACKRILNLSELSIGNRIPPSLKSSAHKESTISSVPQRKLPPQIKVNKKDESRWGSADNADAGSGSASE